MPASQLAPADAGSPALGQRRHNALETGQALGRYVILRRLAAGGMSVVYVAYDPELNREVALKVMRPERSREGYSAASDRLLREAQAMARLAHVNVVHVYDVGVVEGRVYMAMEYVRGETLEEWVGDGRRSWESVVAVLVRAGRGLAAAHAAGLVHLDFKPGNVLVGDDGEVRVVDFGLARPPRTRDSADQLIADDAEVLEDSDTSHPRSGRFREPITEFGTIMGTPGYMAAEQLTGGLADARSDQFAFCATAWVALYRQRPFAGETTRALNEAVTQGNVRDPPVGRAVPARIRNLLDRGLLPDPTQRHASLGDLLDAMQVDGAQKGRRTVIGVGALMLVGFAGYALAPSKAAQVDCEGGTEQFAGVWDDAARAVVRGAILQDPRPFAKDVASAVTRSLDAWTEEWVQIRRDSCVATHVTGEQSADLLDLRTRCLQRHFADFQALTTTLAIVDPTTVEHATEAAARLAPLRECRDAKLLTAVMRPVPPEIEAQVEDAYTRLALGNALEAAGKYPLALVTVTEVWLAAELLGHGPLVVEARRTMGDLLLMLGKVERGTEMFLLAQYAAETAAMDRVRFSLAVELIYVFGHHVGDLPRAKHMARTARALFGRLDVGPSMDVLLAQAEGTLLGVEGRGAESVERFEEALRIHETMGNADQAGVASAHLGLGAGYHLTAAYDDALTNFGLARDLLSIEYGARHPRTAAAQENMGTTYQAMGRFEEAKAEFLAAGQIYNEALVDDAGQTTLFLGLSAAHDGLEEYDEAAAVLARLVEVLTREGRENTILAAALGNLAGIELEREHFSAALAGYDKQIPMFLRIAGPDHVYAPYFLACKARALVGLGRHAEAISLVAGVIQRYREQSAVDPLHNGEALLVLARALHGLEQAEEAVPPDALALVSAQSVDGWLAAASVALRSAGPAATRALRRHADVVERRAKQREGRPQQAP